MLISREIPACKNEKKKIIARRLLAQRLLQYFCFLDKNYLHILKHIYNFCSISKHLCIIPLFLSKPLTMFCWTLRLRGALFEKQWAVRSGVEFRQVKHFFFFFKTFRWALGPTQQPTQWVPAFFLGGNVVWVKNEWRYTSSSPIRFHTGGSGNLTWMKVSDQQNSSSFLFPTNLLQTLYNRSNTHRRETTQLW